MTLPATHNLNIYRGDPFTRTFRLTGANGAPLNLTGWTVTAQLRDSEGELITDFEVTVADALEGRVRMQLTAAQTRALPPRCQWDIQTFQADQTPKTYMQGVARAYGEVTVP